MRTFSSRSLSTVIVVRLNLTWPFRLSVWASTSSPWPTLTSSLGLTVLLPIRLASATIALEKRPGANFLVFKIPAPYLGIFFLLLAFQGTVISVPLKSPLSAVN